MTTVSIRLPASVLRELDRNAQLINISRSKYIRRAIDLMNKETRNQRLKKASLRVRRESMKINAEFSEIDNLC